MYFRQLEYVLTVAEERSFSKAAKKLFIAQPSLSQNIQSIEAQLGTQLFDRTTSRLELTYAGEKFVETARSILDLNDTLLRQIGDIADCKKGRLTVGISLIRGSLLLPAVLPLFHQKFPGIELILMEGSSRELEEYTEKGVTDLIILTLPIKKDCISYETLLTEEILVAIPPNHPLCARISDKNINLEHPPQIEFKDIATESFVLLKPGSRLRQTVNDLFKTAGSVPKISCEAENIVTLHRLVAAGMGLTFIGESVARFDRMAKPPVYFSLKEPHITRSLAVAYRDGRYINKVAREFIAILKEVLEYNK